MLFCALFSLFLPCSASSVQEDAFLWTPLRRLRLALRVPLPPCCSLLLWRLLRPGQIFVHSLRLCPLLCFLPLRWELPAPLPTLTQWSCRAGMRLSLRFLLSPRAAGCGTLVAVSRVCCIQLCRLALLLRRLRSAFPFVLERPFCTFQSALGPRVAGGAERRAYAIGVHEVLLWRWHLAHPMRRVDGLVMIRGCACWHAHFDAARGHGACWPLCCVCCFVVPPGLSPDSCGMCVHCRVKFWMPVRLLISFACRLSLLRIRGLQVWSRSRVPGPRDADEAEGSARHLRSLLLRRPACFLASLSRPGSLAAVCSASSRGARTLAFRCLGALVSAPLCRCCYYGFLGPRDAP